MGGGRQERRRGAADSLDDLRVAEVVQLDMHIVENKVVAYRAKVKVSFKYHKES